ncbi:MAG TPA: hypothetical protein VGM73_17555, partial [Candidatus Didemnitutus sp.]
TVPFVHRGDRPTYHPSVLARVDDHPAVTPLVWQGSADLRCLSAANVLAYFPSGDRSFAAGESVEVLSLDS